MIYSSNLVPQSFHRKRRHDTCRGRQKTVEPSLANPTHPTAYSLEPTPQTPNPKPLAATRPQHEHSAGTQRASGSQSNETTPIPAPANAHTQQCHLSSHFSAALCSAVCPAPSVRCMFAVICDMCVRVQGVARPRVSRRACSRSCTLSKASGVAASGRATGCW